MAFQFPAAPTIGQIFSPSAGIDYKWNGYAWDYVSTGALTQSQADARYARAVTGTRMLFQQTTPPVGWTKEINALYADNALRVITGAVNVVTGAGNYSSFLIGGYNIGGHTLTVAEMPYHNHPGSTTTYYYQSNVGGPAYGSAATGLNVNNELTIAPEGGNTPHVHPAAQTWNYADAVIGIKD